MIVSASSSERALTVQLSVIGPPRGRFQSWQSDWPSSFPVRSCRAMSIPARVIGMPVLKLD